MLLAGHNIFMTTEPNPLDPVDREARDLEVNDWYYRLNAAGTPLAEYFNYSGVPVSYPILEPGESLVFDYLDDDESGSNIPKTATVGDYDEMCQWYNAGRFNIVGVGGWRIVRESEDSSLS